VRFCEVCQNGIKTTLKISFLRVVKIDYLLNMSFKPLAGKNLTF